MITKLVKQGGVFSAINLNEYGLRDVPASAHARVKQQVGEFVTSQIKRSARNLSSPVQGERWKATLSKEYAKDKMKMGGGSNANLRLTGSLLNNLTHKAAQGGEVYVGVKASRDRDGRPNDRKAIGHNHFEASKVPRRRFLPDKGQSFKKNIEAGIMRIVEANKSFDLQELAAETLGTAAATTNFDAAMLAMAQNLTADELI